MSRIQKICIAALLTWTSVALGAQQNVAWAWGKEGHQIVAFIAADNLSPNALTHLASVLKVKETKKSVAAAMATAAVRPDSVFRNSNPETKPWHYIDLCLQDTQADVPARCSDHSCAVEKIDEYATRLRDDNPDGFGAKNDLGFLIHFVGDLHQPLHAATNADRGGNCVTVASPASAQNLHHTWDKVLVQRVMRGLRTRTPRTTATKLAAQFAAEKDAFTWSTAGAAGVAWESTEIARQDVYAALRISRRACKPVLPSCNAAPRAVKRLALALSPDELQRESDIAARQLAKAGYRLASLLNTIWP
jgi:hypothetical protein